MHALRSRSASSVSIQYIALQILETVVKTRWKTLPRAQCEGIRGYIVGLNIKLSSDPAVLEVQQTLTLQPVVTAVAFTVATKL